MALPQMDGDPTAIKRVVSVRRVTPAMTIDAAGAHLHATREAATVVVKDGRPGGVVTAAGLAGALANHGPDTPIATVMDYLAVPVDPAGSADETLRALRHAAWGWLEHVRAWR